MFNDESEYLASLFLWVFAVILYEFGLVTLFSPMTVCITVAEFPNLLVLFRFFVVDLDGHGGGCCQS